MKKKLSLLLATIMTICSMGLVTAQAKVGDVIGTALHTDIVAYVNHYAIPSYAVNGTSVIVAEDLRNFGFDVIWNDVNKTLSISRNSNTSVNQMSFTKTGATGAKFTDILETDIRVYVEGNIVTSYAMNGYTMIPVEELTMLGQVIWVEGERALKLWVDGLNVRTEKQPISTGTTSSTTYNPTPSYGNTAFYTLKNDIIREGTYSSKYNNYSIFWMDDGISMMISYDLDDESIDFNTSSTSDSGSEFFHMVSITNDGAYPWAVVSMTTYSNEYEMYGQYKNGGWSIMSNSFPSSMRSTAYDLMLSIVELFDSSLPFYSTVSLADLGITY